MKFPCNTFLFSYTDRITDRLTGVKTDRQTDRRINSSIFVGGGGGGAEGCGYGADGS